MATSLSLNDLKWLYFSSAGPTSDAVGNTIVKRNSAGDVAVNGAYTWATFLGGPVDAPDKATRKDYVDRSDLSLALSNGLLVWDSFNRENAASLGTSPSGHAWTTPAGWGLVDKTADWTGLSAEARATINSGVTDYFAVQYRVVSSVGTAPNTFSLGFSIRNQYLVNYNPNADTWSIYDMVATTTTQIASSHVVANGDWLEVQLRGNELTLLANEIVIAQHLIAGSLTVNAVHGVDGHLGAALKVDNFSVRRLLKPAGWIAPTLLNSWINFGSGYTAAGYRKDSQGIVTLRGMISGGVTTNGTTLFTLPAGYRPSAIEIFPVVSNEVFAQIRVWGNGNVLLQSGGSAAFLTLSGISFLAEQ